MAVVAMVDDARWAPRERRVHPVEVRIIDALLDSRGQPLSARDLFQACGEEPEWMSFVLHMRRLTSLGSIKFAEPPPKRNPLAVRYSLTKRTNNG